MRSFCPVCLHDLWPGSSVCRRRSCPSYARRYLRDQAERIDANLAVWDGGATLTTLTAPGARVSQGIERVPGVNCLPWDRRKCSHGTGVKCSGKLGCKVDSFAAARWNADVAQRLGLLNDACQARVRRAHGKSGRVQVLAYVCEAQQRGVLHPHIVLGWRTAADLAALDTYRKAMRKLRGNYGFGTGRAGFHPGFERFGAAGAAQYVSKYLRKGDGGAFSEALAVVDRLGPKKVVKGKAWPYREYRRPAHLLRPVWVSPILTNKTGVTMEFLRFKRWSYRRNGYALASDLVRAEFEAWKARDRGTGMTDEIWELLRLYREGRLPAQPAPRPALQTTLEAWPF